MGRPFSIWLRLLGSNQVNSLNSPMINRRPQGDPSLGQRKRAYPMDKPFSYLALPAGLELGEFAEFTND